VCYNGFGLTWLIVPVFFPPPFTAGEKESYTIETVYTRRLGESLSGGVRLLYHQISDLSIGKSLNLVNLPFTQKHGHQLGDNLQGE
jgi:hypothetical protein